MKTSHFLGINHPQRYISYTIDGGGGWQKKWHVFDFQFINFENFIFNWSAVVGDDRDRDHDRGTAGPRIKNGATESKKLSLFFPSSKTPPMILIFLRHRPRPQSRLWLSKTKAWLTLQFHILAWWEGQNFGHQQNLTTFMRFSLFFVYFFSPIIFFYWPKNWWFFKVKKKKKWRS